MRSTLANNGLAEPLSWLQTLTRWSKFTVDRLTLVSPRESCGLCGMHQLQCFFPLPYMPPWPATVAAAKWMTQGDLFPHTRPVRDCFAFSFMLKNDCLKLAFKVHPLSEFMFQQQRVSFTDDLLMMLHQWLDQIGTLRECFHRGRWNGFATCLESNKQLYSPCSC